MMIMNLKIIGIIHGKSVISAFLSTELRLDWEWDWILCLLSSSRSRLPVFHSASKSNPSFTSLFNFQCSWCGQQHFVEKKEGISSTGPGQRKMIVRINEVRLCKRIYRGIRKQIDIHIWTSSISDPRVGNAKNKFLNDFLGAFHIEFSQRLPRYKQSILGMTESETGGIRFLHCQHADREPETRRAPKKENVREK